MADELIGRQKSILARIAGYTDEISRLPEYQIYGRVVRAVGVLLQVFLPGAKISDICKIYHSNGQFLFGEVVAIDQHIAKVLPYGSLENISHFSQVLLVRSGFKIEVGDFLLGKVVNGFGQVTSSLLDEDQNTPDNSWHYGLPITRDAPDPLQRLLIDQQLITGITAIDLFNSCGLGQRMGIFASPGVGKTTLIGMLLRNAAADVCVIVLIGERGREVREFIELELDESIRQRCVLIVATSDRPPVEQVKSAFVGQTIAEHFRDQGKNVLLVMDSVTRFARAQREVGLSAGEPITRGGYPPSVFLSFPRLMERAGMDRSGSITAFYTVLLETEDISKDAVADEVKSILDGHLIMSRQLAESSIFPAIDLNNSLSRIADRLVSPQQLKAIRHIKMLLSKYKELEFLLRIGEYQKGMDALSDEAIEKYPKVIQLVKQSTSDNRDYNESVNALLQLANVKG